MVVDKVTEEIAHFLGLFLVQADDARFRLDYDLFAQAAAQPAIGEFDLGVRATARLPELPGFDPAVSDARFTLSRFDLDAVPNFAPPVTVEPVFTETERPDAAAAPVSRPLVQGQVGPLVIDGPPPGSVLTVTLQTNVLDDNDLLDIAPAVGAAWVASANAQLLRLLDTVAASGPAGLSDAQAGGVLPTGDELQAGLEAIREAAPADASVLPLLNASGWLIGGQWSSEPLEFSALMSLYGADVDRPEKGIVTGGNSALNQAGIVNAWIDAPVIAVGGSASAISAIVQINALRDADGALSGAEGVVHNQAQIMGHAEIGVVEGALFAGGLGLVQVATIHGDLLSLNVTEQLNILSDIDAISATLGAWEQFLSTGGNILSNAEFLQALGMGFDLIVVDGDFLQATWITQTNVLVDDDHVVTIGQGLGAGASSDFEPAPGNALVNSASIKMTGDTLVHDPDIAGDLVAAMEDGAVGAALGAAGVGSPTGALKVLHIKGNLVVVNELHQTNIVLDSDLIENVAGAVDAEGNLLGNLAEVVTAGMPSNVLAANGVYSDAIIYQAGLADFGASPGGAVPPGLTPAAVAFLRGPVHVDEDLQHIGTGALADGAAAGLPADVMQLVLA